MCIVVRLNMGKKLAYELAQSLKKKKKNQLYKYIYIFEMRGVSVAGNSKTVSI